MGTVFRDPSTGKISGYSSKSKASTPSEVYSRTNTGKVKVQYVDVKATELEQRKQAEAEALRIAVLSKNINQEINKERTKQQPQTIERYGVYDNVSKQSRLVSAYESIAVREQLKKSSEVSQPTRSIEEIRTDPQTQRVYFTQSKGEVQPVLVENKPIEQKISNEFTPDAAITARPDYTFKERLGQAKERVKELGYEFMYSFGFGQETREVKSRRYQDPLKDFAGLAGTTAGIVSLGVGVYESVGAKTASILYKNPRVWAITEKVAQLGETKAGKALQYGLLGAYGVTKGVDVVHATTKEGRQGFVRESFDVVRVGSLAKGFSSGFQSQVLENIKGTTYLIKGESRIKTYGTDKSVRSVGASKGKLYEFYDNKLRREFDVSDISKLKGETRELIRVEKPSMYGQQTYTLSAMKGNIQSAGNIKTTQGRGYQTYYASSDVKSVQGSMLVERERVSINNKDYSFGYGKTKSEFAEGREVMTAQSSQINKQLGTGKNKFSYIQSEEQMFASGKASVLTPRVTSQFKYKETIFNVEGKKTSIDLGGSETRAKSLTEQTSQSLVKKVQSEMGKVEVKQATIKPIIRKESKGSGNLLGISKSKSNNKSFVTNIQKETTKINTKSTSKSTLSIAPSTSNVYLAGRKEKSSASLLSKQQSPQRVVTKNNVLTSPRYSIMQTTRQTPKLQMRTGIQQIARPLSPRIPFQVFQAPPIKPVKPPVGGGGFAFFPEGTKKKSSFKGIKSKDISVYSPDVRSKFLNLRSGSMPSARAVSSGLVMRPIV